MFRLTLAWLLLLALGLPPPVYPELSRRTLRPEGAGSQTVTSGLEEKLLPHAHSFSGLKETFEIPFTISPSMTTLQLAGVINDVRRELRKKMEALYLFKPPSALQLFGYSDSFAYRVLIHKKEDAPDEGIFLSAAVQNAIDAVAARARQEKTQEEYPGLITVQVRQTDSETMLSISDEGSGIPLEILQHLFKEPVSTKDDASFASVGGSGSDIAEGYYGDGLLAQMGGWIEIDTRHETGVHLLRYIPLPSAKAEIVILPGSQEALGTTVRWFIPNRAIWPSSTKAGLEEGRLEIPSTVGEGSIGIFLKERLLANPFFADLPPKTQSHIRNVLSEMIQNANRYSYGEFQEGFQTVLTWARANGPDRVILKFQDQSALYREKQPLEKRRDARFSYLEEIRRLPEEPEALTEYVANRRKGNGVLRDGGYGLVVLRDSLRDGQFTLEESFDPAIGNRYTLTFPLPSSDSEERWDRDPEVRRVLEQYSDRPDAHYGTTHPETDRDHVGRVLRIEQLGVEHDPVFADQDRRLLRISSALHDAGSLTKTAAADTLALLRLREQKKIPVPFRLRDLVEHFGLSWDTRDEVIPKTLQLLADRSPGLGEGWNQVLLETLRNQGIQVAENFDAHEVLTSMLRDDIRTLEILDGLIKKGLLTFQTPDDRKVVEAVVIASIWAGVLTTQPAYRKSLGESVAIRAERLSEWLEVADAIEASSNLSRAETFYGGVEKAPRNVANILRSLHRKVYVEKAISPETLAKIVALLRKDHPRHREFMAILAESRRIGQAGQHWSVRDNALIDTISEGPSADLPTVFQTLGLSTGLEENWQERLVKVARRLEDYGWISSANSFAAPFLKKIRPDFPPEWHRLMQSLSLTLEALSYPAFDNPVRVIGRGRSSRKTTLFEASLEIPSSQGTLQAFLKFRDISTAPHLKIFLRERSSVNDKFSMVGQIFLGADLRPSQGHPLLHLDLEAPSSQPEGPSSRNHHWNMNDVWSASFDSAGTAEREPRLSLFLDSFIQNLISHINQLPRRVEVHSVSNFRQGYPEERHHLPAGTKHVLDIPFETPITLYRPETLATLVEEVAANRGRIPVALKINRRLVPTSPEKIQRPGLIVRDKWLGPLPYRSPVPEVVHALGEPFPYELSQLVLMAMMGRDAVDLKILAAWISVEDGRIYLAVSA